MQYCVDHPEEVSKLAKVKAQVYEVKGVMMENIEKVWSCYRFLLLLNLSWMFKINGNLIYCLLENYRHI